MLIESASAPTLTANAFHALYLAELDYVVRSLRRLGVATSEVNDLCQEVFVAVFQRYHTYDARRPLKGWLFGIAFRAVSEFHRRAHVRREHSGTECDDISVEQPIEERDARRTVLRALDCLPPERRAVFIMHELDGCSAPEIAETLGIPLNTAYSRLRIARAEFEIAVKRLEVTGGAP